MHTVDKEKLSNERVETTTKRVAHAINLLETGNQELKWACEAMEWNDEICYQISDAIQMLGMALATLVRWNDPNQRTEEV